MANAFNACICIDYVNRIALADRFSRAFWNACSARDAFLCDFHRHDKFLLLWYEIMFSGYVELQSIGY